MSKALLIGSNVPAPSGTIGQWNELTTAESFIQGIKTGDFLDDMSADKIAALISGVPTPWARAKLFKFALDTLGSPDPQANGGGLLKFYESLQGEWRGLVALMALFGDRISVSQPVEMNIKGEQYDIASAMGRMLFEEKDLWSNQQELASKPDAQPFVQLIYYQDQLVGGTSPLTGVFTGVDYSKLQGIGDVSWYRNGKLEDPTRSLKTDELQRLYLFVSNMSNHVDEFEKLVNSQRQGEQKVDLNGLKKACRQWAEQIQRSNPSFRKQGPITSYKFSAPFSVLFDSNLTVWMKEDRTFTYNKPETGGQELGNIQDLLLQSNYILGWSDNQKLANNPVYYLNVKNLESNTTYHFALPLSQRGVDIFYNRIDELLGYSPDGRSKIRMTGLISPDFARLKVEMTVEIDGDPVALNTREYIIEWMEELGNVILWPNFSSKRWHNYYMYSEFLSDSSTQFQPIYLQYDDKDTKTLCKDDAGNLAVDKGDLLVSYNPNEGSRLPKYSILRSQNPIEGLLCTVNKSGHQEQAGLLMVRHEQGYVETAEHDDKQKADIGIDFGSNNTCVYHYIHNRQPAPVEFENYRVVLVGSENTDVRATADNNELLFFSNAKSDNGQLKSWLHEQCYSTANDDDEVAGGVPVSRSNVDVREMNEYYITTQAGTLHYNMKWLDDDKGQKKKTAFLKTIWLQTCAFLYKKELAPETIRWSHPGAMMQSDVTKYELLFSNIAKMHIVEGWSPKIEEEKGEKTRTEAEAVCSYALGRNIGLTSENLILGLDVGGSTTDILLLARNPQNNENSLYRESSVRLAAGVFFQAITSSATFRNALLRYQHSTKCNVHVSNIDDLLKDGKKAPYVLNNIFDQLRSREDYEDFYGAIASDAKFVFTMPAYVTGLLLFYAGMLVGKTLKQYNLTEIKRVDFYTFGKGGRLFHWLRNASGSRAATNYYAECLKAGAKLLWDGELSTNYCDNPDIEKDNKAEVAIGLCEPKELNMLQANIDFDICGEENVEFTSAQGKQKLEVDSELDASYFANNMRGFDFKGCENFRKFMDIFIDFLKTKTDILRDADKLFQQNLENLPSMVANYITNKDSEYKKALREGDAFHYHQPIIIAEGMAFLGTLVDTVFKK